MKNLRICFILLPALILAGVLAPRAGACSDQILDELSFRDAAGFRTLVTDAEGETHRHEGVPDVSAMDEPADCPDVASYAVYCGEDRILEAEIHRSVAGRKAALPGVSWAGNGYYAVEFDVSGSQTAFITGLTADNLYQVQTELIAARQNGKAFDMTHVDFIDAEKMDRQAGSGLDSNLCWAAAASNILHYTGWGAKAHESLTGPDAVFQQFIGYFNDSGLNSEDGIRWFFSGINLLQGSSYGAQVKNGYGQYGFLPDYAPGSLMRAYSIINDSSQPNDLDTVLTLLRKGWGCTLSLGWYKPYGDGYCRNNGHAVTLWGYLRKKSFEALDPNDYTALLISDSDSDKAGKYTVAAARNAENRLTLTDLSYVGFKDYTSSSQRYGQTVSTWQLTGYRKEIGLLEFAAALQPYSDSIPREDWSAPHGDRFDPETPDFSAGLLLRDAGGLETETFVTGDTGAAEVSLFYGVRNDYFSWTAPHPFQAELMIRDREGKTVYTSSRHGSVRADQGHHWGWTEQVSLPGGTYSAVVTVRAPEDGPEPYYSNNTFTQVFTVVDPAREKLRASLTGRTDGRLQFDVSAPFSVEYSQLYVRYGKGNAWCGWIDTEEKGAFSPGDADRAVFAAWLHRDGQSFCLQSDVVPLR